MIRGIHGEKLVAALRSNKLPTNDKELLALALRRYDNWIIELGKIAESTVEGIISCMVASLNEYKNYIDIDIIFDSKDDFLYRQKGQLKLDNSVVEEFLPLLVKKCIEKKYGVIDCDINTQTGTFSSVYFNSSLSNPTIGGGLAIKVKAQDFSMSRKLYIKSSHSPNFEADKTISIETSLGYIVTEIKTNLDKTMFQEASATAHDIKLAVTGSKYFLLCEWLDMTPISTATTDIDEAIILRKAKRMNSNIRANFSTYVGRRKYRDFYVKTLRDNPYSFEMFKHYVLHIFAEIENKELIEDDILRIGFF